MRSDSKCHACGSREAEESQEERFSQTAGPLSSAAELCQQQEKIAKKSKMLYVCTIVKLSELVE
jgi:hypothetical protein